MQMQIVSDNMDTLHLQQGCSVDNKQAESVVEQRAVLDSWLHNTCTMLRGLWSRISRSLYDLLGAGFGRSRGFVTEGAY